jgi:hypothetical protein
MCSSDNGYDKATKYVSIQATTTISQNIVFRYWPHHTFYIGNERNQLLIQVNQDNRLHRMERLIRPTAVPI